MAGAALAQDEAVPEEKPVEPPVRIIFAPPALDGRFVMGIFDGGGRLVRTLIADRDATVFDVGLNGYITWWDGKDDAGLRCPGGVYSARGYVVGEEIEVSGEAFHFNDWVAEDGVRATDVWLRPWTGAVGLDVAVEGEVTRRRASVSVDGVLRWELGLPPIEAVASGLPAPTGLKLPAEPIFQTPGRDGGVWAIFADGELNVVSEFAADGECLRELRVPAGEPQPVEVLAAPGEDAILLKESSPDGTKRVRLLRREAGHAADETEVRTVVDWEIVFERTIVPCAKFGIVDGRLVADAGAAPQSGEITMDLALNELDPRPQSLTLKAVLQKPGACLAAPDGLKLLPVSGEGAWSRVVMAPGDKPGAARLALGDGLVVEEFTIRNLDQIAPFDCGSFTLAGVE